MTQRLEGINPRGISFDLYGTLLIYGDMRRAWSDWLAELHDRLEGMGLSASIADLSKACDGFFSRSRPSHTANGHTVYENRLARLFGELGIDADPQDLMSIADSTIRVWQAHVQVDPLARSTIERLSQTVSLALVSNFDHPRHVRSLLTTAGLTDFFDVIVISGDVEVEKPNPRIFDPALSSLGLHPSEVVHVGDTRDDVEAAQQAGIFPVLIKRRDGATDHSSLDFNSESHPRVEVDADGVATVNQLDDLMCLV